MSGQKPLSEQNQALALYLGGLLRPGPTLVEPNAIALVDSASVKMPLPGLAPPSLRAAQEAEIKSVDRSDPLEVVVPEWAQKRFPCLIFAVAGLRLAVPLIKLTGVVPLAESLTTFPGEAPWLLGLTRYRGQSVRVVDTAEIVLPEDRRLARVKSAEPAPGFLVVIGKGRWGLACDAVSETLPLETDDVKWRSERGKRLWLAGTVRDKLCALLDVDALVARLDRDAKG